MSADKETPGREPCEPREPRARRRAQGALEAQVLSVLGTAREPATAAWVQARLDGDLAYTTVITILTRLYEKGAVTRSSAGRPIVWQPVADSAGLTALRMRRLLDQRDDRDAVLSSFVSALSSQDEALLRSLLLRATPGSTADAPPRAVGG
ncbi:BlaI/MecI/CopY family transcriptional regulator [Streptomyces spiramyceticus]|uniref:BlaI/MecI/CopY family transcriptional regulator n=1 Tax=Streptomyces spiramyceticus TaxID=299717 RepID=UPI00237B226F|nr:BlaI/MecI/CopY family transcriptional regulator [Streptomyces spiramyceticus]